MRPLASDRTNGGGNLVLDWMRMTPYAASGTFTSRVLDAGSAALGHGELALGPPRRYLAGGERAHRQHVEPGSDWSAFIPNLPSREAP